MSGNNITMCEECDGGPWPPDFLAAFAELPGCPECKDWAALTSPDRQPRTDHSRADVERPTTS